MRFIAAVSLAALASASGIFAGAVDEFQPTVRASGAWIQAPAPGTSDASAFVVVDNGTMYDIYIVGASTDVAATLELRDTPKGAAAPVAVKEVPVAAYGRLEMSPQAVHLHLGALERPLAAGDIVTLVIYTDIGEQLTVSATVK